MSYQQEIINLQNNVTRLDSENKKLKENKMNTTQTTKEIEEAIAILKKEAAHINSIEFVGTNGRIKITGK